MMIMKPTLKPAQIRFLRAQAHHLNPVVMVGGKGVTETLLAELDSALNCHELIKVSIAAPREERKEIAAMLCEASKATLVQLIGGIAVLYRPALKPCLVLPAA
jgi:RNA-binding protein